MYESLNLDPQNSVGHTQWLVPITPVNGEGRTRRKGGSSKQKHINLWFPHACSSVWVYLCHASKYILVSLCLSVCYTLNTHRKVLLTWALFQCSNIYLFFEKGQPECIVLKVSNYSYKYYSSLLIKIVMYFFLWQIKYRYC